ncbi:MAG: hypothetical protein IKZ59_08000 [Clostridia bacterium]|nr:hypothetical protein [Clostridia bacterium]
MRKRVLTIISFCVILALAIVLSACNKLHTSESNSDSEIDLASEKATPSSFDTFDEFNSKVYPLDISCKDAMSKAHTVSRYEEEIIKEKFISIWDGYIRYYYGILMEIDDEKVFAGKDGELTDDIAEFISLFDGWKDALIEDQKNWEKNTYVEIATMQKLMNRIYTGGSATGSGVSSYKYSLYRQRALYLYHLCTLFNVSCDEPN